MLQYLHWVTIRALFVLGVRVCVRETYEKVHRVTTNSYPKLIIYRRRRKNFVPSETTFRSSNTFPLLLSTVSRGEEVFNRTKQMSEAAREVQFSRFSSSIFRRLFQFRPGILESSFKVVRRFKESSVSVHRFAERMKLSAVQTG